jgi:hypothetical protein
MANGRLIFVILIFLSNSFLYGQSWIRINQLGYTPESIKNVVLISKEKMVVTAFQLFDALTDEVVYNGEKIESFGNYG